MPIRLSLSVLMSHCQIRRGGAPVSTIHIVVWSDRNGTIFGFGRAGNLRRYRSTASARSTFRFIPLPADRIFFAHRCAARIGLGSLIIPRSLVGTFLLPTVGLGMPSLWLSQSCLVYTAAIPANRQSSSPCADYGL